MEPMHRAILIELRQAMIIDMDVLNHILQPLAVERILSPNDIFTIMVQKDKPSRAKALLDILPHRGPRAFAIFLQSLGRHYSWLRIGIINLLNEKINHAKNWRTDLAAMRAGRRPER